MLFSMLYETKEVFIAQSLSTATKNASCFGFNVGLHVSDNPLAVLNNRATLLSALHQKTNGGICELSWLDQTHSNHVVYYKSQAPLKNADALITDQKGVGLCIMTADCVPIAIFEKHGKIACIHAGTKGLQVGIIKNTAQKMGEGQKYAYVGACISQACYELPQAMACAVIEQCFFDGLIVGDINILKKELMQTRGEKALLDVGGIARKQLFALGISVINADSNCTYQNTHYYSHRRATHQKKPATGRMAFVIAKLS